MNRQILPRVDEILQLYRMQTKPKQMNNNQVKADLESAKKDIAEILNNLHIKYDLLPHVSGDVRIEGYNFDNLPARITTRVDIKLSTK